MTTETPMNVTLIKNEGSRDVIMVHLYLRSDSPRYNWVGERTLTESKAVSFTTRKKAETALADQTRYWKLLGFRVADIQGFSEPELAPVLTKSA